MTSEIVESTTEHTEAVTSYEENGECDAGLEDATSGE